MASPFTEVEVDDRVVKVTNPDRVYFPERGRPSSTWSSTTSRSDGIVNALFERPCMLHRFPKGLSGDKVHQKRLPSGAPPTGSRRCGCTSPDGVARPTSSASPSSRSDLGRADVDGRVPPLEQPPGGPREARRVADRPRPRTASDFARAARRRVTHELLDELGAVGSPRPAAARACTLRPDPSRPRLHGSTARRARVRPGGRRRMPDDVTTAWWRKDRDPHHLFVD